MAAPNDVVVATAIANHNAQHRAADVHLDRVPADGGSQGDPNNNGQNVNALLVRSLPSIRRLAQRSVRIPPDNPFAAAAAAGDWLKGTRNPGGSRSIADPRSCGSPMSAEAAREEIDVS